MRSIEMATCGSGYMGAYRPEWTHYPHEKAEGSFADFGQSRW